MHPAYIERTTLFYTLLSATSQCTGTLHELFVPRTNAPVDTVHPFVYDSTAR